MLPFDYGVTGIRADAGSDVVITGGTGQWWHTYDAVASKGTDAIGKATALADGSSVTALTYSFMSTQPQGQAMNDFQPMSEAQKGAVRKAFDYYSKLINEMTEIIEHWDMHPMAYDGPLKPLNAMIDVGLHSREAFENLVTLPAVGRLKGHQFDNHGRSFEAGRSAVSI